MFTGCCFGLVVVISFGVGYLVWLFTCLFVCFDVAGCLCCDQFDFGGG